MDGIDDGFKGFGEGFDGFPKRLPEDCVEYSLYIIDSTLESQKDLLSRLEDVRKESVNLSKDLTKDYIWHRDGFKVDMKTEKGTISTTYYLLFGVRVNDIAGSMYLDGITNYGDSVEDEWLIVYILKELSSRFPTLWIKVVDSDGEFLLIEAANALPRWLNPEIADNRVVADSSTKTPTVPVSRSLTLKEAQKILSSTPEILIHSPLIEEEAFYRLRNYPAQIADSLHHARITIPRKLAYVLHLLPTSIAPAVEAFYLRDPIALKPLQTASSSLVFPPKDLVTISTRFTKVLYAQLKSQQFSAPFAWRDVIAPTQSGVVLDDFTKLETGMKVTSGFEMLVTDPKNGDYRSVREINILLEDLEEDNSNLPNDNEMLKWKDSMREDDEKWLDINFEDFERELDGKNKEKKSTGIPGAFDPEPPSGFGDAKTEADLKKMVERFEAFLNYDDAGPDGAEMDDMDNDDDDDEEDDEDDEDSEEDKDVSFDEAEFAKMMREMMGMPADDIEEPATRSKPGKSRRIQDFDGDDEDEGGDEMEEIQKVMNSMEAELNEAGALSLGPTSSKIAALSDRNMGTGRDKQQIQGEKHEGEEGEEESDEELDIDFNLAKNLLESFKSQGGMAGPGSNLLGMMGMKLPRDEDDEGRSRGKRPE
ncbi:hypothetical protein DSL72_001571 [Monilinia vaccinii-corymbosi]|uniref:Regulatory factor Sgt1 n=1 Tax=Monilinia vaccinii-corymbosi TaxID=61207 RepID=A0A8A3P460_9HELO|nr:hypothetical protein DSL72_001571 [Monilinia vaccinii-corymbosi]